LPWRAYFTSEAERRERSAEGSEKSWEEVEAPTLSKLSEVDTTYQTPKELKVGTLLEGLVDTIPVGVGKAEAVEVIKDHMTMADGPDREYAMNTSIQTVLAEWNKVCAGIELFNGEFGKLGKGEEKTRESISTTVFKIHDAIRNTDAWAYLLAARIRRDNTMASGEGAKSVWDTLRRVCNSLGEVYELIEAGNQETLMLTETIGDSQEKMGNMSQNLIGLKQYVVDSIATIHRKVTNLERTTPGNSLSDDSPGLNRPQGRLEDLEDKARGYARTASKNDRLEWLEVEVCALQRRMDQRDHDRKLVTDERASSALGNASGERNLGLQDQIDNLTLRVNKAEAHGTDESFEMDQFAFGSFAEFTQMVLDEKVQSCRMFWDLFSALVSMRSKGLSGKERADEQYSSERIKTTIFENNLLASMSHTRPACLYAKGGIGMLVGIEDGFGACESHAQWIAGVESMKKVLGKQL
jgi:hypothetical protein